MRFISRLFSTVNADTIPDNNDILYQRDIPEELSNSVVDDEFYPSAFDSETQNLIANRQDIEPFIEKNFGDEYPLNNPELIAGEIATYQTSFCIRRSWTSVKFLELFGAYLRASYKFILFFIFVFCIYSFILFVPVNWNIVIVPSIERSSTHSLKFNDSSQNKFLKERYDRWKLPSIVQTNSHIDPKVDTNCPLDLHSAFDHKFAYGLDKNNRNFVKGHDSHSNIAQNVYIKEWSINSYSLRIWIRIGKHASLYSRLHPSFHNHFFVRIIEELFGGISGVILGKSQLIVKSRNESQETKDEINPIVGTPSIYSELYNSNDSLCSDEPLSWMQLSDLHFGNKHLQKDNDAHEQILKNFQTEWKDKIRDIIITGDLTHGKWMKPSCTWCKYTALDSTESNTILKIFFYLINKLDSLLNVVRSTQTIDQWKRYLSWRNEWTTNDISLLDMMGNHDSFGTSKYMDPFIWNSENDQFNFTSGSNDREKILSEFQKLRNKEVVSFWHLTSDTKNRIVFICLSAHPFPTAPFPPYNFSGVLSVKDLDALEAALKLIRSNSWHQTIIIASHYPNGIISSSFTSSGSSLHDLIREYKVSTFISGHLHTLFGLAPKMYAQPDYLELELADVKNEYRFRLMAYHHGAISITDEPILSTSPVILVTSPQASNLFQTSGCTHFSDENKKHSVISFYIYTRSENSTVSSISVSIENYGELGTWKANNEAIPTHTEESKSISEIQHETISNFYEIPIQVVDLLKGVHTLKFTVEDSQGNRRVLFHQFTYDGIHTSLPIIPKVILLNWLIIAQHCFIYGIIVVISFSWIFRLKHRIPLTLISFSMIVGPWYTGEFAPSQPATITAFGFLFWDPLYIQPNSDVYMLVICRYFIVWYLPMVISFMVQHKLTTLCHLFGVLISFTFILWAEIQIYGNLVWLTGWNVFWLPLFGLVYDYIWNVRCTNIEYKPKDNSEASRSENRTEDSNCGEDTHVGQTMNDNNSKNREESVEMEDYDLFEGEGNAHI